MRPRLHLGVDVTSVKRWERAANASRLAEGILSANELTRAPARQAEAFAAKEAVLKALRTGIVHHDPHDVEVDGSDLHVRGALGKRAEELGVGRWHLSTARAGDVVIAVVVGEAVEGDEVSGGP